MSSFAKIDASRGLSQLARDLDAGVWHERNADILALDALDLGYRSAAMGIRARRQPLVFLLFITTLSSAFVSFSLPPSTM